MRSVAGVMPVEAVNTSEFVLKGLAILDPIQTKLTIDMRKCQSPDAARFGVTQLPLVTETTGIFFLV